MNETKVFYGKYKSLVYNLAFSYSDNKEDVEEIMQDVFLSVFLKTREKYNIQVSYIDKNGDVDRKLIIKSFLIYVNLRC